MYKCKFSLVLVVKKPLANAGNIERLGLDTSIGKIPRRRTWQPTLIFLPGNPMDRGAWWATVHRAAKSQTRLK